MRLQLSVIAASLKRRGHSPQWGDCFALSGSQWRLWFL